MLNKYFFIIREFLWDKMLIGHSLNIVGNKIYILGGTRGGSFQDSFYSYDAEKSIVEVEESSPAERAFH